MKFAHFCQVFPRTGETTAERYEQLWRELQLCDEVGFDYGFTSVHHFERLRPQAAAYCAGGAARTKRIRLGPMGYTTALYDPMRIVEEAIVLDNMMHGRLEIGLTAGVTPEEFRVYQADWEKRADYAMETMQLLRKAFLSPKPFDFEGQFHSYERVHMAAEPVQVPHPPIWLMSIDPERLPVLAAEGVHTGYLFDRPRKECAERLTPYLRDWKGAGHDDGPNIIYLAFVYVDETDAKAIAKATPHMVHSMYSIYDWEVDHRYELAERFRARGEVERAETRVNLQNMEYLTAKDLVFVGSPDTVAQKIKDAAEEGLFNVMGAELNIGALPEEDLMRSIRLFGEEVIPQLKDFDPARDWMEGCEG